MDAAGANIFGQSLLLMLMMRFDDVDDQVDEDDGSEPFVPDEREDISPIEFVFEQSKTEVLASILTRDSALVEVFENILKALKKENITISDADGFAEMVKQVLENKFFANELHKQCEDPEDFLFCALVNTYGVETLKRVNRTPQKEEKTEERMALIRSDDYFDRASVGGTPELVVRGVLCILIGYCISKDDLWNMGELIDKISGSEWGNRGWLLKLNY